MENTNTLLQKMETALQGTVWTVTHKDEGNFSFATKPNYPAKYELCVKENNIFREISDAIDSFTCPSAMDRYGITITQAYELFDDLVSLRKKLRLALNPSETKSIWLRIGMSLQLTLEEFAAIEAGGDEGEQILRSKIQQDLFRLDGEAYSARTEVSDPKQWDHGEIYYDM